MDIMTIMLAQETGGQAGETTTTQPSDPAQPGDQTQQNPGSFMDLAPMFLLMFAVMYFILFRPQQKQRKQHQQMLDTLKKNDRIRTIGGIMGTVVDVKETEVVVKVDESNNTKMHFARNAISKVLTEEEIKK